MRSFDMAVAQPASFFCGQFQHRLAVGRQRHFYGGGDSFSVRNLPLNLSANFFFDVSLSQKHRHEWPIFAQQSK